MSTAQGADGWRARDIAGRIAAVLAAGGAIGEAEAWRRRADGVAAEPLAP
jgi:hypothetical protein